MTAHSRFVRAVEAQYDALVAEARAAVVSAETAHAIACAVVKAEGDAALAELRARGLFPFPTEDGAA